MISIVFFIYWKLELLMQFPTSNDEKYLFLSVYWKETAKLNYLTNWASTTKYIIYFSDIFFVLKSVRNHIQV